MRHSKPNVAAALNGKFTSEKIMFSIEKEQIMIPVVS